MKRIIIIAIALVSLLSLSCTSFAADAIVKGPLPQAAPYEPDETPSIQPMSTTCTLSFKKTSSTKARAFAAASRSKASSITSTIYLQKKSGSSYSAVTKSTRTVKKTYIEHSHTFTVSSSASYRIKVVIKYTRDGVTRSNTYYKSL